MAEWLGDRLEIFWDFPAQVQILFAANFFDETIFEKKILKNFINIMSILNFSEIKKEIC